MKKSNTLKILIQILFWVFAYSISVFFRQKIYGGLMIAVYTALGETAFFIIISYVNIHVLFKRFYEKNRFVEFALYLLLFLGIVSVIRFHTEVYIAHLYQNDFIASGTLAYLAKFITSAVFFAISSAYYLTFKYVFVRDRQMILERDKLIAEMEFLKARINPHFLFNTLSNIHSLAFTKSDRTADMVLQLSDLMRYMFYDCKEQTLPLSKEVEFIENYIKLQQMKTPYEQSIILKVDGSQEVRIEPLLFISFVENAIKYSNVQQDGFINISFKIKNDKIVFSIKNSIDSQSLNKKDENSGFGLSNVKERLKLLYAGQHIIEISDSNDVFDVILIINLQRKNQNIHHD